MTSRENMLRAIRFERPERIPMTFHINGACWHHYDPDVLQELMAAHPLLFPGFTRQAAATPVPLSNQRRDAPYTDPWGCVWETTEDGITGSVHGHPLADWGAFAGFRMPDPETTDGTYPLDWSLVREQVGRQRAAGELVCGGLPHGHTFLRLQDLRGYENLIFDMLDEPPPFQALLEMVETFNARLVDRWLELKPDLISYPEDLGMQVGPMLSPELFRRFIKPVYQRLMKPARDQGCVVHMHSDGDLRTLLPDLLEGGVEVVNLQDLVNGIDWIAGMLAGRVCVELDIDRQQVTARGTPGQIDALIREEVAKLGCRQGGLMMIYGLYPGVSVDNVRAVMDAMERYAGYYA